MNNISIKGLELKAIFALILPSLFLGVADNFLDNVFWGVAMLLVLGALVGLILPNIVSTWLILILTVLGISGLTLGYVRLDIYAKAILLLSFPVEAYLASQLRECIFRWSIYKKNEASVYRYITHYDQNVKLQTTYNAQKLYQKISRILREKSYLPLWDDFTIIKWEHDQQFAQFNLEEHSQILKQIAKVLKKSRLVDENLYYLGNGEFLIISNTIAPGTLMVLNDELKAELRALKYEDYHPAFKMATQHIVEEDLILYPDLDAILKHLKRKLETDLVVEYLKGVES